MIVSHRLLRERFQILGNEWHKIIYFHIVLHVILTVASQRQPSKWLLLKWRWIIYILKGYGMIGAQTPSMHPHRMQRLVCSFIFDYE